MSSFPRPKKSLGQNFLNDGNICAKIIRSAHIGPDDAVLEVGPGRGALTELLAAKAGRLVAIEFDHDLAAALSGQFSDNPRVTVIDGDILKAGLADICSGWKHNWKVVANLPYNISTPVLFRFLELHHLFSQLVLMLQKEVGERLVAAPGTAEYGVITVLFSLWFDIRREFIVPPSCFHPRPKVDSAVVSFIPLSAPRAEVGDRELFTRLVKAAFSMRRKTLDNCLKHAGLTSAQNLAQALSDCSIDGKRRGETLSLDEFAALSLRLSRP